MSKSFLNSTTALVVSTALAMPAPGMAQATLSPCVDAEGSVWTSVPERGKDNKKARKAAKKKDENPTVALTGEAGQCAIASDAGDLVVEGTMTETGEIYASFKQVMAVAKAAPDAEVEAEAEVEDVAEEAAAEAEALAEAAEAEAEAVAEAAEAEAEALAEAAAEEAAAVEAQAEAEAAAVEVETETEAEADETEVEAEAETDATAQAEETAEPEVAEEAAPEADPEGEASATEEEGPTEAEDDPTTAMDNGDVVEPIVEGAKTVEVEEDGQAEASVEEEIEVQQDDTEESTAAANATVETQAAASGDADAAAGEVEVETRKVTEADTRKSSQDFSTAATAQVAQDDDGLSNFEKFAIGALGVAAVGTLLNNGNKVVSNSGDRMVVERADGEYEVLKDDNALLRQPGVEIKTERFNDGSTRETVFRENGTQVVTIKSAQGQVLRRVRVLPDGTQVLLFDDTATAEPVRVTELPQQELETINLNDISSDELRIALAAQETPRFDRRFSLQQIRQIRAVRELVPVIELEAVNFDTGSAAIRASEAEELRDLGVAMSRLIEDNPYEVFLVEGHTDAVGGATYNLALSDRRAESVALALTEYFDVPPENMVVQGYGESNLKIRTPLAERENRRATVRRITTLLKTASIQ